MTTLDHAVKQAGFCVYRIVEEGRSGYSFCGEPATHLSCTPEKDSPTCAEHKCKCAVPIGSSPTIPSTPSGVSSVIKDLLGPTMPPPRLSLSSPPAAETIDHVMLRMLRDTAVELGEAREGRRLAEKAVEELQRRTSEIFARAAEERNRLHQSIQNLTASGHGLVNVIDDIKIPWNSDPLDLEEWNKATKRWNDAVEKTLKEKQ